LNSIGTYFPAQASLVDHFSRKGNTVRGLICLAATPTNKLQQGRRKPSRLHLEFPFAASRMLKGLLVAEGGKIGALYHRPRTARARAQDHPCLLRGGTVIATSCRQSLNGTIDLDFRPEGLVCSFTILLRNPTPEPAFEARNDTFKGADQIAV
jgi:hypothetical protein